jgi:hypothetical protein
VTPPNSLSFIGGLSPKVDIICFQEHKWCKDRAKKHSKSLLAKNSTMDNKSEWKLHIKTLIRQSKQKGCIHIDGPQMGKICDKL